MRPRKKRGVDGTFGWQREFRNRYRQFEFTSLRHRVFSLCNSFAIRREMIEIRVRERVRTRIVISAVA